MNIQTEHLDNHTARLTVEVEPERLEKARQAAIRNVSKMIQVPGFRKGKAPAQLVLRYVGEARILEEAIDELGQEIYRETLDEAQDIKPYGPGALEDIKYDPLVFVYTVPLQPTIELGDYRSARVDFTVPEISDEEVNRALESLRDDEAVSEETEGPAVAGDRITVDLHSFFVDEDHDHADSDDSSVDETSTDDKQPEAEASADTDTDAGDGVELDEDDTMDDLHERDGEPFIHEHGLQVILREGDEEPLAPGFTAEMIGATVGETREFTITYPTTEEDADIDDEVAGRTVEFVVSVQKIEKVTLPEWSDELASRLGVRFAPTEDEIAAQAEASEAADETSAETAEETADETAVTAETDTTEAAEFEESFPEITVDQLRARIRYSLEHQARRNAEQEYSNQVLTQIVQGATTSYPEMMMEEQLDRMVLSLDQRLRQQGLSLDMYQSITGKTREDLHNDYRAPAEETIKRSLVLLEVAMKERLLVTNEDFDAEIDQMLQIFGGGSPELRKTFDNPSFRETIYNRILQDKTYERLMLIGKGEAPELPAEDAQKTGQDQPAAEADTQVTVEASVETAADANAEAATNEADSDSNV